MRPRQAGTFRAILDLAMPVKTYLRKLLGVPLEASVKSERPVFPLVKLHWLGVGKR